MTTLLPIREIQSLHVASDAINYLSHFIMSIPHFLCFPSNASSSQISLFITSQANQPQSSFYVLVHSMLYAPKFYPFSLHTPIPHICTISD
jgi:hypothetical protein